MSLASDFAARYARPPSTATVDSAVSIHTNVRAALGDSEYATFLQGSYKNDTALWDMNDVDIVALSRGVKSSVFTGTVPVNGGISWNELFARVERKLQAVEAYKGKWTREDKCIRLNTGVKIDIVPAVYIQGVETDAIAIYSFKAGAERKNWPRDHYTAGTGKSGRTSGAYKQTVRLFKRWAKCWFGSRRIAPSYYIECAVHAQPDAAFSGDAAADFVRIGEALVALSHSSQTLPRLAGEGDLFTAAEWPLAEFTEFQATLKTSLTFARAAVVQTSEQEMRRWWVAAFNGQNPS